MSFLKSSSGMSALGSLKMVTTPGFRISLQSIVVSLLQNVRAVIEFPGRTKFEILFMMGEKAFCSSSAIASIVFWTISSGIPLFFSRARSLSLSLASLGVHLPREEIEIPERRVVAEAVQKVESALEDPHQSRRVCGIGVQDVRDYAGQESHSVLDDLDPVSQTLLEVQAGLWQT